MQTPADDRARQDTDVLIEERLGLILRGGVLLSTGCLAVGLALTLFFGGGVLATQLLAAGIVLLLATPVARVAMSVVEYTVHRDWTFVVLTGIVLMELLAGVVAAFVFHRRL